MDERVRCLALLVEKNDDFKIWGKNDGDYVNDYVCVMSSQFTLILFFSFTIFTEV